MNFATVGANHRNFRQVVEKLKVSDYCDTEAQGCSEVTQARSATGDQIKSIVQ